MTVETEKPEDVEMETEKRFNFYATGFFVVLMIVCGLPLWWYTTRVYRVDLPYNDIKNLNSASVKFPVNVKIVYVEENDKIIAYETAEILSKTFSIMSIFHPRLSFETKFSVEQLPEKFVDFVRNSKTIEELDESIFARSSRSLDNFALNFVILPVSPSLTFTNAYFGVGSYVYIQFHYADRMSSIIERCLTDVYLNKEKLISVVEKNLKQFDQHLTKFDRKSAIQTNIHPKSTIEISVVVPDPANCKPNVNLAKTFEKDFHPFVDGLRPLTDVKFKSQVLYYVDFGVNPKRDEEQKNFYYESDQLPHLISALETYTGGFDAEQPIFRIVAYLTPPSRWPLFIKDQNNEKISIGNSFIVSSWGGVIVINAPEPCANGTSITSFDAEVQNVILAQVRQLLGFGSGISLAGSKKTQHPLALWEVHSLLYEATLDYVLNSISTLNSLVKLLDQITNIVINDDVGAAVESAVASAHDVFDALESKEDLKVICDHAKKSRFQSERAFFDQSLLAFLYFPEDQKYAIYIPLFLPISFPVILSMPLISKYTKYLRESKKKEKMH